MEETDAASVARTLSGDSDGFRTLVDRHGRAVFKLAYRMTGNEFDAEDIVQETFLRAYRQLGNFESRASFRTWVYRIASNYALDVLRSRRRNEGRQSLLGPNEENCLDGLAAADPSQERLSLSGEVKVRLDSALGELSDQERTAFVLRHFEGLSIDEIGSVLSIGASATKNSIFRAVRKVRQALEPLVV